jgi:hypothetical protein
MPRRFHGRQVTDDHPVAKSLKRFPRVHWTSLRKSKSLTYPIFMKRKSDSSSSTWLFDCSVMTKTRTFRSISVDRLNSGEEEIPGLQVPPVVGEFMVVRD